MDLHELTTRNDIGSILSSMGLRTGAEIGVAFGENAEVIMRSGALDRIVLVDPWDYVPGQNPIGFADAIKDWRGCFNYCLDKMRPFGSRVWMLQSPSVEAAAMFKDGSFDFIYIDANHARPYIDQDLAAWWPKLRDGGIFGGHDYHMVEREDYSCGVKAAVDEFFTGQDRYIHVTTADQDPSWYTIK